MCPKIVVFIHFLQYREGLRTNMLVLKFVLFLECESEGKYIEWRKICPPPPGATDWYEVFLTKDEYLPMQKLPD
jgi:hypothetical protein